MPLSVADAPVANAAAARPARRRSLSPWRPTPEGQPVRLKLRRVDGFRRKEVEKLARRSLDPPSTVVSDGLACFRGVTDAGCTHQPIRTGSGRTAVRPPAFKWVNTALGNIETAIPPLPGHPPATHPPLPGRIRLPLRSTLRSRRHDAASRLGRRPHPANALPPPQIG